MIRIVILLVMIMVIPGKVSVFDGDENIKTGDSKCFIWLSFNDSFFLCDKVMENSLSVIRNKLKLLKWRKDWRFKFFVYCHPDMKSSETIKRIEFLKSEKCLPYIMRDLSCWNSKCKDFYTDLAAWCNQPNLFKNMTFKEFIQKRHKNYDRIKYSLKLYENR